MDRDLTRVRILSFCAACAVIVAALLSFAFYRVGADRGEVAAAIAVVAFVENRQPVETPPPTRRAQPGAPHPTANQGERDNVPRLWRYGPHGEIVFAYAEQFDRCNEARRKHIDEADCPSSRETREYVLDQSADAPLVLAYRRH